MTAYWLKLGDVAPPRAWAALEALAERTAGDPDLPPLVPDDFLYAARVVWSGLPDLHVLRHVLTAGYLAVDDLGGVWRFVGRGAGVDGYAPVATTADAFRRAGLDRAERLALRTLRGPRRPELRIGLDDGRTGDALDDDRTPASGTDDEDALIGA